MTNPVPSDPIMAHIQGFAQGYDQGYIYAHTWDIDEEWNILAEEAGPGDPGTPVSGLDHAARSARAPSAGAPGPACSSPASDDPALPQPPASLAKYIDGVQFGMEMAFRQSRALFEAQSMFIAASMMERAASVISDVRKAGPIL